MSELGACMVGSVARLVARLPLRWAHAVGAAAGWVPYLMRKKYARRVQRNLHQAAIAQDGSASVQLRRAAIAEQGKAACELPFLWLRPADELLSLVRSVEGMEHVDAARASGRGIIFITPHLGSFEMAGRYLSSLMPMVFLYRPPRVAWLEPIMLAGRTRDAASMAPTNTRGVRMMFKTLKAGRTVGILPDQAPAAGEGVWADFFGRPAYTMTLIARLQQSTGASVIPLYVERLSYGQGYIVKFFSPIYLQGYTPAEGARCLNLTIETMVRCCPQQYLWSYNRYKRPEDATPPPSAALAHASDARAPADTIDAGAPAGGQ